MGVIGRNTLWLGRRWQTRAGLRGTIGTGQRQRHRRRYIVGRAQRIAPKRHALRHVNLRTVFIGRKRMVASIALHALMEMQESRMIKLDCACMGVDERRHRLQGDEQPEHQEADDSVRHCQAENIYG